jgi:UDP-glucose:(heptosyl)LPS alpha-1,3-glucosyltransferase
MRLAFVVHDYNKTGGHSRYVAALVERVATAHEVHVFASTFDGDLPRGVTAHTVPALRLTALTTILSFPPVAARMVNRERFDLVHAQGFVLPRADIVTVHICNGRWLDGRRDQGAASLSWKDHVFASVVVPLERRMYRRPGTTLVAISDALRADLTTLYGVHNPIAVVHHCVDAAQFNPGVAARHRAAARAEVQADDREPVFLFVGDLRKGAIQAIRALAGVPGRLLLVSRSDPGRFLAIAAEAGIADRVTMLPPTHTIERWYGAADVFVLPTPYDAFGMVVTEAMACGLPVVTTRAAGAAELVVDGQTGYVLDAPVDESRLRERMHALAADPALRRRVGDAAARAMTEYSWDRVAERTVEIYERALLGRTR